MNLKDFREKKEVKSRVTEVNLTDLGGAFSLIYSIQKELYGREETDVVLDYFSMGKFKNEAIIAEIEQMGGKIFSADLRHNRLVGFIRLPGVFYKYCKENKVETVHIHGDSAYLLQMYSVPAKLAGVKNIIVHSHSTALNGNYRRIKTALHKLFRPFIGKSANRYLSCSNLATKWMYPEQIQSKAVLLKNGVDISKFEFAEEMRKRYRDKLGIEEETVAVAVVGDMSYPKNPMFICDVMKDLEDRYKLFFIGDGPCRKKVENYVMQNGLSDKVVFLGRRNVSELLNAMDIFAMPSRSEGLPVSGVEAQANGLPCIFASTITKQVGILNTAHFVDIESPERWADTIKHLKLNVNNRVAAAKLVEENGFDIHDTAECLYRIYRSCV